MGGPKFRPFPVIQGVPHTMPTDLRHPYFRQAMGFHRQLSSSESDSTKYEPSRTLCELITDRLVEQSTCLLKVVNECIEPAVAEAMAAQQREDRKKRPGDRYVDAHKVVAITQMTSGRLSGLGPGGASWWPRPMPFGGMLGGIGGSEGVQKAKDPMMRYQQLAVEIDALINLSDVDAENPYEALESRFRGMASPTKSRFKRIVKIVGLGDSVH
ncbi:hypothetical protein LTR85_004428 [Meristemomyces frigidus]|nr:hypothetical protein LTR85_004428 [Meristemomyces frigidus]